MQAWRPLLGAHVIAVHAIETNEYLSLPPTSSPIDNSPDSMRGRIQTEVDKIRCAALDAAGIEFKTVLLDTGAAAALLVIADDVDADMIVVGQRGLGGSEELLLGSAPHRVAHHARRPVVIVPSSEAA